MKKYFPFLLLSFILVSCSERYKTKVGVSELIPEDYNSILKINSPNDFKVLSTSDIPFKELKEDAYKNTEFLNSDSPIYITNTKKGTLYISDYSNTSIKKDSTFSLINKSDQTHFRIYNGDTIYRNQKNEYLLFSKNYSLTKNLNKKKPELEKLISTSSTKEIASLLFRNQNTNNLLFRDNDSIFKNSQDFIDLKSNGENIAFSGISISTDSTTYINAFKNTNPQKFQLAEIIPSSTNSIIRIAFDDFSIFHQNLSLSKGKATDSISEILNLQNEIALIENSTGKSIVLHALDAELLKDMFALYEPHQNFRGINIFKVEEQNMFNNALSPFLTLEEISFGFIYDNFSVFANDTKILEDIISSKLSNQTLSTYDKFRAVSDELAYESSLLYYKNGEGLYNFLQKPVKGYNANVVQYVYDTDFAHINGVFKKYRGRNKTNSITENFTTNINSEILLAPQLVKNHRNKTYEIVVQDIENKLYLISSSGKILWTKQLRGPVLGDINQIDIYKNGRLQLVFATPNQLYIIDRNGKDVGPFPKKFNDKITQPLSVFDYDNRKNYRLLVTQNKSLLMFDINAKRINGFKYKKAENTITSQPRHFRIGSKDYIVFSQGNKLEILNRQGQERVKTQSGIQFSENDIFLYQNKFTTLDQNGSLIQVDTKGHVGNKNINLASKSWLETTSKTLVALNENKLRIKQKIIDLDFGSYSHPKIFYLNDKIYVSVTDLQSKKVYIFDSLGKLLPNFPVFGTESIKLQNIDKKRGLELVTQADEKTILVYKIN